MYRSFWLKWWTKYDRFPLGTLAYLWRWLGVGDPPFNTWCCGCLPFPEGRQGSYLTSVSPNRNRDKTRVGGWALNCKQLTYCAIKDCWTTILNFSKTVSLFRRFAFRSCCSLFFLLCPAVPLPQLLVVALLVSFLSGSSSSCGVRSAFAIFLVPYTVWLIAESVLFTSLSFYFAVIAIKSDKSRGFALTQFRTVSRSDF